MERGKGGEIGKGREIGKGGEGEGKCVWREKGKRRKGRTLTVQ